MVLAMSTQSSLYYIYKHTHTNHLHQLYSSTIIFFFLDCDINSQSNRRLAVKRHFLAQRACGTECKKHISANETARLTLTFPAPSSSPPAENHNPGHASNISQSNKRQASTQRHYPASPGLVQHVIIMLLCSFPLSFYVVC